MSKKKARYPLEGEISEDGGKIYLDVYGKNDTYLGSIKVGRKPSQDGIEWAKQKIKERESNE